jgi:hypothetical protein
MYVPIMMMANQPNFSGVPMCESCFELPEWHRQTCSSPIPTNHQQTVGADH